MIDPLALAIARQVAGFRPITLAQMENVTLMDRVDAKFALSLAQLPDLLANLRPHYRILEVVGYRMSDYQTLYYDTPELALYHQHQRGRLSRYKIRKRQYVHTGACFLEIKVKTNKGRTIKTRIRRKGGIDADITLDCDDESRRFLTRHLPLDATRLQPVLRVDYSRITLVSQRSPERLTLDLNLHFTDAHHQTTYPRLVIAEVKQELLGHSPFLDLMKQQHVRQGSLSKYCFGIISLNPLVRHNRFKTKLRHLAKFS